MLPPRRAQLFVHRRVLRLRRRAPHRRAPGEGGRERHLRHVAPALSGDHAPSHQARARIPRAEGASIANRNRARSFPCLESSPNLCLRGAARRGRITRHPSLPTDAGESRLRFSAAVTERTMTRRERARRTRLPPLQVLVPDLDRVASISPPCRAKNELFPSHSPPALATERSSPVPPASPAPEG